MSLSNFLDRIKSFTPEDRRGLLNAAREHRNAGMSQKDAEIAAVQSFLSEAQEERTQILGAVHTIFRDEAVESAVVQSVRKQSKEEREQMRAAAAAAIEEVRRSEEEHFNSIQSYLEESRTKRRGILDSVAREKLGNMAVE